MNDQNSREPMQVYVCLYAFELIIDSILLYNIFVIMSEALLSDNQVDLIRSVIGKDKKQQLARNKESYRKLKKDRVKDILNNPSSINDEMAKQNHKEAVKHILYENFEDSIVTASYDQKIIGLCEKESKENNVEVRLSLGMLYRQDEMEEKLNDQERIRSEQKSKQMKESRKSLVLMKESRKQDMLMSPSPTKEKTALRNAESQPPLSVEAEKISHLNQDESQSLDRVAQNSSSYLGKDSVPIESNDPISQQDASFNNSIMNSPAFFLPYNHSQHHLLKSQSKQEKYFLNPQLSPPEIDSLEQNIGDQESKIYFPQPKIQEIFESFQGSQEVKTQLPQPKIQEIFENVQMKSDDVSRSVIPEPIIENISHQDRVASSSATACEAECIEKVVDVEQEIVEQSLKDISVQQNALQPSNIEYSQPQSQESEPVTPLTIQPKIKTARVEAIQFPLMRENITESVSLRDLPEQSIKFIYEISPGFNENTQPQAQIIGIDNKEEEYEIIQ